MSADVTSEGQAERCSRRRRPAGDLDVADAVGVSPVDWDTRLLASKAVELGGRSALDMGTGTGFVAIYLALHGIDSEGVDINPAAVRCARANARKNRTDPVFHRSDLFENCASRYDLIVFNPPYGNAGSARSTRLLEIVKSMLPKEQPFIRRIAYRLTRAPRIRLIERFLIQCRDYLDDQGRVLMLLHRTELPLVADFSVSMIERHKEFRLIVLRPRPVHQSG